MSNAATPEGTQLTERQELYLRLAEDEGKSYAEIALQCGVSVGTVSSTISFVRNRALAIAGERELTARQLEILRLVGSGYTTKEIGAELYMSPFTVVNHLRLVRDRLGAINSLHAVMLAIAHELLILDSDGGLLIPYAHRSAA